MWKCKDGRLLRIKDMETDHIRNAEAMLRRAGWCSVREFDDAWLGAACCLGEMSSYYAEQAASAMLPHSALDAFEAELARRGA